MTILDVLLGVIVNLVNLAASHGENLFIRSLSPDGSKGKVLYRASGLHSQDDSRPASGQPYGDVPTATKEAMPTLEG
jgi:hypothetical protein